MSQTKLPLQSIDISPGTAALFQACNSAKNWWLKSEFYKFKKEFLAIYGNENDYDVQIIRKPCYDCEGTGLFHHYKRRGRETCWSCRGTGIFSLKHVLLKRFILNDNIYHEPIAEIEGTMLKKYEAYDTNGYPAVSYTKFEGKIVGTIIGLIKHDEPQYDPTYAFFYLLYFYNKNQLYYIIINFLKSKSQREVDKFKQIMRRNRPLEYLKKLFHINQNEIDKIEELPF
jgi:hypothetical protein